MTNLGLGTAFDVVVTDTLPDFINPLDFSITPTSVNGQIIQWQIDSLGVEDLRYSYSALQSMCFRLIRLYFLLVKAWSVQ